MAQADAMRREAAARREIERLRIEAEVARTQADEIGRLRAEADAAHAEADAARAEADAARKVHWPQWLIPLASAVLSAVIALGSVYLGAQATRQSNQENFQSTANEQRQKENRDKRAQVYADYLAAERAFVRDAGALARAGRNLRASNRTRLTAATAAYTTALTAARASEQAFSRQADLLFVYGSDEAWQQHNQIAVALQDVVSTVAREPVSTEILRPVDIDSQTITLAEQRFRIAFCSEVPAEPREGCK